MREDGSEEPVAELKNNDAFGHISVLCNIRQPFQVRVHELCRLLQIERQSLCNLLQMYFKDRNQMLINVLKVIKKKTKQYLRIEIKCSSVSYLQGKGREPRIKQVETNIKCLIAKQEAELALGLNNAAYYGDMSRLQLLISAGADPNKTDYDGRTSLVLFLITLSN